MARGTINFTQSASSGSYIVGKMEWRSVPDIKTNTSMVTANIYVKKGNTTTTLTIPTEGTWRSYLSLVGGPGANWTGSHSVLEDWVWVGVYDWTVTHDSNGSKSITLEGYIGAPTGTSLEGHTTRGRATVNLDNIKRETTIDSLKCSTSYVDGTITALYTPKHSEFYNHRTVYVNVNEALTTLRVTKLGTKATSQQTSTIDFSDDELSTIYAIAKNTTKVKIRVAIQTYSDSDYTDKIGSTQSLEISLSLPLSVTPTAALAVNLVNSNAWVASKNIYVAGLSGAIVALSATPGEGAKLTSTAITYNGATYNAAELNITAFKKSGDFEIEAKVTDSRGRSATATENITVLPYSVPAVTFLHTERGTYNADNESWTAGDNGPDIRVVFKSDLALAEYDNVYDVVFELDGSQETPIHGTTTSLSSGENRAVYFRNVDGEVSHALTLVVTDSVGKTGDATLTVPTVHITVEYRANGKGIAFGKTSERDAFECAWPAYFSGFAYTDGFRVPLVQWGTKTITPSAANTPTSAVVEFAPEFKFPGNPAIIVTPQTTLPGTKVLGTSASNRSATGFTIWLTRTDSEATTVHWIAIY